MERVEEERNKNENVNENENVNGDANENQDKSLECSMHAFIAMGLGSCCRFVLFTLKLKE
jgi:hypothetical protein